MSRTNRLLELLLKLPLKPRYTVQELADDFAVSRRTMLRDLQALSAMGVPLHASPGPQGGYGLLASQRLLPLTLSVDEALGIILAYDAFLAYAQSPFAAQHLSAITKLRQTLPPDVLTELDQIGQHVAMLGQPRHYEAPLLADLLRAAVAGEHLQIIYDSTSGTSERVIFPYGLYAAAGFWYCACYDYRRQDKASLRADRILSATPINGYERPEPVVLKDWLSLVERHRPDEPTFHLRARVNARGLKNIDLANLFSRIARTTDGEGLIDETIPTTELDYYARRLLAIGPDIVIDGPPELLAAMRDKAQAIIDACTPDSAAR